jgi:predicted MFS family arabinose efflux permease
VSAPQTAARRRGSRWFVVAAAMFCCGWGGNQFTPLLLLYRRLGGYSPVTVDAFLGAYVVGLMPGLLIGGPLSDRYGRKPLMWWGTAVSAAASAVLAAGPAGQAPIYAGRFLTGIAVGIAMTVGSSWVKELSGPPHDPSADAGAGARRASLSLTAGFGLGAGVAGVLAQWGPWPMVLPYLVHVGLTLPVVVGLRSAPETHPAGRRAGRRWPALTVPAVRHPRFRWVVVPMAPWVFATAGVAYAVVPQLEARRVGAWGLAYATLLTVATLAVAFGVQPLARRLDCRSSARAVLAGMLMVAGGITVCAGNAWLLSPWLGLAGALVLGAGYGIGLVSGLQEVQRIAAPADLAGLTGVYYALCYVGFLLPTVLAALATVFSYAAMLVALAAGALACLNMVARRSRSYLPTAAPAEIRPGSSAIPRSAGRGPSAS